jgi:hypothetical protein
VIFYIGATANNTDSSVSRENYGTSYPSHPTASFGINHKKKAAVMLAASQFYTQ